MIVQCKVNSGVSLPDAYIDPRAGYHRQMEFALTIGKAYVVYAVGFRKDQVWYYISDDDELYYPGARPAPLFEIVDGRLPRDWRFAFTPHHRDHLGLLAIEAWSVDPHFYDRLTDGDENTLAVFGQFRSLLQAEGMPCEPQRLREDQE